MGYKIGKVYRITKNDDPNINYVGSTFTTLRQRWNIHKKNDCSIKKYFDEYGIDKFKIILIKEYEVFAENQKDTKQLRAYEQLWINKFRLKDCCINKYDAIGLLSKEKLKEYKINNREEILEKAKEYRENNKDKIREYRENNKDKIREYHKEYYENNKDKIKEYQKNNKDKIKEYQKNNKDKILEYQKEFYDNNKEKKKEYSRNYTKINKEKLSQKIECPICNKFIRRYGLKEHQKTKKCLELSKI